MSPITSRQAQVAELLAQGLKNKEIAARLRVSESAVKVHVSALMTEHETATGVRPSRYELGVAILRGSGRLAG